MLSFFKRKKVRDDPRVEGENELNFLKEYGLYSAVWEKKRQPSPGAQAYAFESLGLVGMSPINGAVNVRAQIAVPLSRRDQPVVMQTGMVNGLPTVAGQIYGQTLYDPAVGYTKQAPIIGVYSDNIPYVNKRTTPVGGEIM